MAKSKAEYWLTQDGLNLLSGWARDGLTDKQIASNMGINRDTLYRYKRKYTVISDTLKKSKAVVDLEVENALLKRALGFDYEEITQTEYGEKIETKKVKKTALPDTTAQIFWLKNRKPDVWRDKQEKNLNSALDKLDKLLEEQSNA